jgi:hypothetical protein
MTTRTRAAQATTPAPAPKPTAKKTAAKRTSTRPARKTAPKPANRPVSLAKRPRVSLVKPPAPLLVRKSEFITELQIAAYYAARTHNLPAGLIRDWQERPDGTVTRSFPSGALLAYTPDGNSAAPFHTFTPCAQGAHHCEPIHTPNGLRAAVAHAVHCHTRHYTPKALALVDGIQAAKKTTADTEPLSVTTIAAGLAARAADTETPKGHPEP